MAKNKESNSIASVEMLSIGVINKHTTNFEIGEGNYSVLLNYQTFSNLFLLSPIQLFFSINCRQNRLLHVSFIELYDFIILQHLNTRTKISLLATSQIAQLYNQFNHACTANF